MNEEYDSFRDFVEIKYKIDIFEGVKHPEMIKCLHQLYLKKYYRYRDITVKVKSDV